MVTKTKTADVKPKKGHVPGTIPVKPAPIPAKLAQEPKPVQTPTQPKSGDQKPVPSGDQKSAPDKPAKKKKKTSETVTWWREQKPFEPKQKITVLVDKNPKRNKAATRFAHYRNDMTVEQYQDIMSKNGHTKKGAMADMRWDYVSGFIAMDGKRFDPPKKD